jgi:hypothetical protein
VDARILQAARHNVITTGELVALGLSHPDIAYRVASARLHRRHRGVYAVGRPDLSLDGTFFAAVSACGPEARLGHRSALRKWGLHGGGTYRIDVIAPRSIKPKPGIRLHRPLCLDALDTTELDGIPITSVAQTLLDVAAPAHRLDIGKLIHNAIVAEAVRHARDVEGAGAQSARSRSATPGRGIEGGGSVHPQRPRSGGALGLSLVLGARGRMERVGLGWREARGGRLPVARVRIWDVQVNGTPAQVAAKVLAAMHGPRNFE